MSKEVLRPLLGALYNKLREGRLTDKDIIMSGEGSVGHNPHVIDDYFAKGVPSEVDTVIFKHFNKSMGTILDVGAHWGYTAMSMRFSGTDCPIISFEALEDHAPCLMRIKELDRGGYDFRSTAVSDSERVVNMYGPVINGIAVAGVNSVEGSIFNDSHVEMILTVLGTVVPVSNFYEVKLLLHRLKCQSLDKILESDSFSVPVNKIAVLKIDVEGHEVSVLEGARQTIARDRPFLMTESGNRDSGVTDFLTRLGYGYAERERDHVVQLESNQYTEEVNGYWFHEGRLEEYRATGLVR